MVAKLSWQVQKQWRMEWESYIDSTAKGKCYDLINHVYKLLQHPSAPRPVQAPDGLLTWMISCQKGPTHHAYYTSINNNYDFALIFVGRSSESI